MHAIHIQNGALMKINFRLIFGLSLLCLTLTFIFVNDSQAQDLAPAYVKGNTHGSPNFGTVIEVSNARDITPRLPDFPHGWSLVAEASSSKKINKTNKSEQNDSSNPGQKAEDPAKGPETNADPNSSTSISKPDPKVSPPAYDTLGSNKGPEAVRDPKAVAESVLNLLKLAEDQEKNGDWDATLVSHRGGSAHGAGRGDDSSLPIDVSAKTSPLRRFAAYAYWQRVGSDRRQSWNRWTSHCPIHRDRRPSSQIRLER